MRWMKHLMLAHDDEALAAILEEMGPEGYGIYWLLLEHVAAGIEKDSEDVPSRTHSVVRWAQICHCSPRIFRKFADRAAYLKLIESSCSADLKQFASRMTADRLQIDIPKLLKYRDEYSKKSGQTPRQSRGRVDGEAEGEQRQKKPAAPPPDPTPIRPEIPTETERRVRRIAEQAPDPQDFELGVQNALREVASSINPESTLAAMEENLPLWWAAMREGRTKCKTLRWIIPDRDYLRKPREPTTRKPPPQSREETLRKALMED